MIIFRIFLSEILGPSVARNFFSWTQHDKKINFRLFWIKQVQIVIGFDVISLRKLENSSFWKNVEKYLEKTLLFQELLSGFLVFLWKYTWQPMTICTCWIKKSLKFIFLLCFVPEKKFLATLGPKTSDKKSDKWSFLRLILG